VSLDDLRNETEMKTGISAFIITKNEAHKLAQCLESVAFCDEIIILDSGSTDGTVELAKQYGCKVTLTTDWPGFGIQKQRALDLTSHDWILSVDSDEVISLGLQETIKKIMAKFSSGGFLGYRIRRTNLFLGKELQYGGWGDDEVLRFARRTSCRFSPDRVHEQLLVDGIVGLIDDPIIHHARESLQDVLEKQMRYVLMARKSSMQIGEKPSMISALFGLASTFLNYYFLRLGFLDGTHGFFAASSRAQGKFWTKSQISPMSDSMKVAGKFEDTSPQKNQ